MASLLRLEPSQRLTADQAIDHPWLLAHGGRATVASSAAVAASDVSVPTFAPPALLANVPAVKPASGGDPAECAPPVHPPPVGEAGARLVSGTVKGVGLCIDVGSDDDPTLPGLTSAFSPGGSCLCTGATPRSAASLPTPTHLRALKASGALKQQWNFNRDPAAACASGSSAGRVGKRPLGGTEVQHRSGWGTLADEERAIHGESGAAAGIVTSTRE